MTEIQEYECNNGHITTNEEEIQYGWCSKCGKKLIRISLTQEEIEQILMPKGD